jgi:hypothetical protein
MMIMTEFEGSLARGGMSIAPVRDYYVDREIWGLTHIVMIDKVDDIK